jgi:hypothetical protein
MRMMLESCSYAPKREGQGVGTCGRSSGQGVKNWAIRGVVAGSLEEATEELSAFTYLLHPPDLQRDGLSATLSRYAEGFGRRTGLKISVRLWVATKKKVCPAA